MSDLEDNRNRVRDDSYERKKWNIVAAAVVAILIIGGAIYAYSNSGNDTSPAVTNAPPRP